MAHYQAQPVQNQAAQAACTPTKLPSYEWRLLALIAHVRSSPCASGGCLPSCTKLPPQEWQPYWARTRSSPCVSDGHFCSHAKLPLHKWWVQVLTTHAKGPAHTCYLQGTIPSPPTPWGHQAEQVGDRCISI